jgi:hypothetical protein
MEADTNQTPRDLSHYNTRIYNWSTVLCLQRTGSRHTRDSDSRGGYQDGGQGVLDRVVAEEEELYNRGGIPNVSRETGFTCPDTVA